MDSYPGTTNINFLGDNKAKGQVINSKGGNTVKSRVIDGFVKGPQTTARGLHQRSQKAQTLMRGTLKKPSASVNRTPSRHTSSNPLREIRAKQTATHSKVERFGGFVSSMKTNERSAKEPLLHGEIMNTAIPKRPKPQAAANALPSMVTSASHQRLERMLDAALTRADSHKEALKYESARHFWQKPGFFSKKRWLKLSVLALLMLGICSFIAWQKVPEISLKLASLRAHVDASVPSYKPVGYAISGPAEAQNHAVTLSYKAVRDKSIGYTIEEQASDQDSSTLIADNSSPNQQVQTTQANGIPIVIIRNKVKCVSNGIETTITNQANLSADELLNIAKSICA